MLPYNTQNVSRIDAGAFIDEVGDRGKERSNGAAARPIHPPRCQLLGYAKDAALSIRGCHVSSWISPSWIATTSSKQPRLLQQSPWSTPCTEDTTGPLSKIFQDHQAPPGSSVISRRPPRTFVRLTHRDFVGHEWYWQNSDASITEKHILENYGTATRWNGPFGVRVYRGPRGPMRC